jgi:hypothetical protein
MSYILIRKCHDNPFGNDSIYRAVRVDNGEVFNLRMASTNILALAGRLTSVPADKRSVIAYDDESRQDYLKAQ